MRVYTEFVYGHMVEKPAPGTFNHYRKCSPYPFAGEVAVQSPTCNFLLSLEGFRKVHMFTSGKPQAIHSSGVAKQWQYVASCLAVLTTSVNACLCGYLTSVKSAVLSHRLAQLQRVLCFRT